MKLTKAQKEFIDNVNEIEEKLEKKLWLQMNDNKWVMGTHENEYTGFYVNGKLVKSLTDKGIIVNEEFKNVHGASLTGMTLNDQYRYLKSA